MRSLVFILKHRDSTREKVVTGEISVKKLVSSSVEQLTEKIYNLVVYHVGQTVFIFMLNKHTIFFNNAGHGQREYIIIFSYILLCY